jgi:aldose sugar dehydrogenase
VVQLCLVPDRRGRYPPKRRISRTLQWYDLSNIRLLTVAPCSRSQVWVLALAQLIGDRERIQPDTLLFRHPFVNHPLALPIIVVLGLAPCLSNAQLTHQLDSTTLLIDVVLDSSRVNIPWDIVWGPDERLWMTDGKLITRWDPATDVLDTLLERPYGNGMGLALHPDFPQVPWVYAVFDTAEYYGLGSWYSEVFRFQYDPWVEELVSDTLLLGFGHLGEHSGGRLLFDSSGNLVITTAEWGDGNGAYSGNTLRIAPDGSIPPGNPWGDLRWTIGHRNPQGLAMLPDGKLVNTELCGGGSEIDMLIPGTHHGWPWWDGNYCWYPEFCDPLVHTPPLTWYISSVSGCGFYTSDAIPEFTNCLIACGLWSFGLVASKFNETYDDVDTSRHYSGGAFKDLMRIRDIAIKPDGSFYLITNDRDDARIRWVRPETSIAVNENQAHRFELWPNPTTGLVTVSASPRASLIVMDALGHNVDVSVLRSGGNYQLDLSGQASGLYAIRVTEGITVRTQRVVKR